MLAEVTTDLAIVAERRTAQGDELALYVWGPPGRPGEVVFARRRPPPLGQPAGRPDPPGRLRWRVTALLAPRARRPSSSPDGS